MNKRIVKRVKVEKIGSITRMSIQTRDLARKKITKVARGDGCVEKKLSARKLNRWISIRPMINAIIEGVYGYAGLFTLTLDLKDSENVTQDTEWLRKRIISWCESFELIEFLEGVKKENRTRLVWGFELTARGALHVHGLIRCTNKEQAQKILKTWTYGFTSLGDIKRNDTNATINVEGRDNKERERDRVVDAKRTLYMRKVANNWTDTKHKRVAGDKREKVSVDDLLPVRKLPYGCNTNLKVDLEENLEKTTFDVPIYEDRDGTMEAFLAICKNINMKDEDIRKMNIRDTGYYGGLEISNSPYSMSTKNRTRAFIEIALKNILRYGNGKTLKQFSQLLLPEIKRLSTIKPMKGLH